MPATAQTTEAPPQSTGSATAPSDSGNSGESADIVVTAQKRSEAVSRVPASISVVTGDTIASRGITSVAGLENQVPNIAIGRSYDGAVDLTIRGISSSDDSNKGDPAVALNIDGIYVGRPQAAGASFYDLERVEVLRGPQGTLYGRNANAGAINVVSRRPTDMFEAGGDVSYGNYNFVDANAFLNVPITDGVAMRAVVSYQDHDGFSHTADAVNGFHRNQDDLDNLSGRVLVKAAITPRLTILAGIDGSVVRGAGAAIFPVGPDGAIPYARTKTAYVEGNRHDFTTNGFAQLDYDFGALTGTYLYGHRYLHLDDILDLGGGINGVAPPVWGYNAADTAQDSHEVRLTSNGNGPLKLVVGGYFFREVTNDTDFDIRVANFGRIIQYLQGPTISKSQAVFGQATYSILPHTRITGGLRSTWDQKSRVGVSVLGPLSGAPAAIQGIPLPTENAAASYSKVTWRAGIEQDLTAGTLAYFTVSTGYKAGGFNDGNAQTNPSLYYAPETITSYEGGVKARLLDGRLFVSASGFYYDYTNLQKSTASNNSIVTVNAAKANVKGIEGEAQWRASPNDRINVSIGLLDAKYDRYIVPNGQHLGGYDLDKAPDVTLSANVSHDWHFGQGLKLTAYAGTRYSASYTVSDPGTLTVAPRFFRQGAVTKSELSMTLFGWDDRWSLQAFGRNLENNVTIAGLVQNGGVYYIGFNEPRLYGIKGSVRF